MGRLQWHRDEDDDVHLFPDRDDHVYEHVHYDEHDVHVEHIYVQDDIQFEQHDYDASSDHDVVLDDGVIVGLVQHE
jgi:hypothetical protein